MAAAQHRDQAVLFVNGRITDYSRFDRWVSGNDYLVGVDGGTHHCLQMALQPDLVVGDLDSLSPPVRRQLEAASVPFLTYPAAKDQTDLELALHHVLERGIRTIVLLGMWGGRLDQSLANLLLMARLARTAQMTLVTENEIARVLWDEQSCLISRRTGATVSLCPLSPQVEGVTLVGMEYPLQNALLPFGSSLGISNVVTAEQASVSIRRGQLLVIVSRCGQANPGRADP